MNQPADPSHPDPFAVPAGGQPNSYPQYPAPGGADPVPAGGPPVGWSVGQPAGWPGGQPAGEPVPDGSLNLPTYPPYPAYPGPGRQPAIPVSRVRPPGSVIAAFWIILAQVVLSLVGVALLFTDSGADTLRTELEKRDLPDGMTVDQLVNLARGVAAGVVVLVAVLVVFFAVKMRGGRNWARVTLTVLSALLVVSTLSGARSGVGLVGLVIAIVAIVLMYLAPSNSYFRAATGQRLPVRGLR